MKIAIDIRSLSEGRHSGVEEYTIQIIKSMVRLRRGHSFHLFHNSAKSVNFPFSKGEVSIHAWRYPNKIFNLAQWATGYPRWDKMLDADCFFVPNFRLMPLSSEVPLVTTVHDLTFDLFPEYFSWKQLIWHKMVQPELIMENSDHLIAVSQATANDMSYYYKIPKNKITVIHSGVDGGGADIEKIKEVQKKYNLPQKFILYLGVLEPRKNISGIIEAWLNISGRIPHDLVIAGETGWLKKDVKQAALDTDASTRIHWPGFVDEKDKPAFYAAADLFVYPSFYEGFGFPPLEALLAGTPVVTSNNSSLPEVVGSWATMIDPYNVTELSATIKEMLDNPEVVSEEIKDEIRNEYSWNKAAKETLDIIEKQV